MESTAEHLAEAKHNHLFGDAIVAERFADRAVVALFYRALHLTSAVIHAQGDDHGKSHPMRQRSVERHFSRDTAIAYEQLYSRSRFVRYDQLDITHSKFNRLLRGSFEPLLREVQRVLPEAE